MLASLRREYGQFITSGAQLVLLFIGFQLESREGWIGCLGLMCCVSFFAWSSSLRRRRAIADTPTSHIASAAQGYVELRGEGYGLDDPPLNSKLSFTPCLWYRFLVEERTSDNKWSTHSRGESDTAFIIDDGSGRCVVDVEGAEILTQHKRTWTEGSYRKTEWLLQLNDPIYALGEFKTMGGSRLELDTNRDINGLLAEWKKDQPNLLKRFDLDGDGSISMKEWMLARQAARREVSKLHQEARNEADVHTMSCPSSGQLYLLSNLDPDQLANRYLWWAIFHITVFFGSLAALPWLLNQHF